MITWKVTIDKAGEVQEEEEEESDEDEGANGEGENPIAFMLQALEQMALENVETDTEVEVMMSEQQ
eukprot:IDg22236t1